MELSNQLIAKALGVKQANVETYWPRVKQCLSSLMVYTYNLETGALATIRVECPTFAPLHEYGSEAYLNAMYDTRTDLGNTPDKDGDGARYCGRGFIQITGKSNYDYYGRLLGVDLLNHPERAMETDIAASIFAAYFKQHGIDKLCQAKDWEKVRRKVNGGLNGYHQFLEYIRALENERRGLWSLPS